MTASRLDLPSDLERVIHLGDDTRAGKAPDAAKATGHERMMPGTPRRADAGAARHACPRRMAGGS